MPGDELTPADRQHIKSLLQAYQTHRAQIELFQDQLLSALRSSANLNSAIHSVKSRLKDPAHLSDKLARKIRKCKQDGTAFDITPDNLLVKVNDLVGVRLLHLHTRQITSINAALLQIFNESLYQLLEGPSARTWDDESRLFFQECGIETKDSRTLYTSVHYVVSSASRITVTAEIQVRTLMEEVWGEVDHTMNYPHPMDSVACREQLKVLARVTSSASRLVDSIFASVEDHDKTRSKRRSATKRAKHS
jgi:putative GTP pyrophosphokinase